jgi:hypothetical protein
MKDIVRLKFFGKDISRVTGASNMRNGHLMKRLCLPKSILADIQMTHTLGAEGV